jgi:regulator of replication initiation timing
MVRLEQMTATNTSLDSLVKSRDEELNQLKSKFKGLVNKQNATASDLAAAKKLVGDLNGKIDDYIKEIARLQKENKQLTTDKENLTTENKNLSTTLATTETAKKEAENKVDVGSTLNASAFNIVAINEKSSGKERSTSSSKRADKLRISFNLDANRISTSGAKQLFIVAKDPNGNTIKEQALASGSLATREEGQVQYTTKVDVDYKQGETKYVSFDLRQTEKYAKGSYSIIVYQNGFKIGQGTANLK